MSYVKLLSSLSQEREDFVDKIYSEIFNNSNAYNYELQDATYKEGKSKECNKCKLTKYSDRFCEGCISLQLQSLFTTWTSGNNIIDHFIQQCQMKSSLPNHILEWIPFEQFKKVTKLTEGGFSSIFTAGWTRGTITDYNENKKEFSYFGAQGVVL